MENLYTICHDSTARIEDWMDSLGRTQSHGFDHPSFLLEEVKGNRTLFENRNNILVFDRMWMNKLDMATDPIVKSIRDQLSGLYQTWILSSNFHDSGDYVPGWDIVLSGRVLPKKDIDALVFNVHMVFHA